MSFIRSRIGLVVDHPQRDLAGAVLTARALAVRGVDSVLIPLYQQGLDVPLLGLNGLVLNYARLNNRELIKAYHDLGLPLFVVDTEGGVLSEVGARSPDGLAEIMRQSGLQAMLDGYCFWGSELERAFAEANVLSAEQRRVTGCPRFDLCAPRWQSVLTAPDAGYVLLNTNFSGINPRFSRSAEAELEAFASVGMDEGYVRTLVAELRTAFEGYVQSVEELVRRFPSMRFRLRPHPFERAETYRERFGAAPNLEVVPEGDIFQAVHNALCVLHLNCGTAVEAVMLRRLPVQMEHLNTPFLDAHAPLPGRCSLRTATLDELAALLEDVERATKSFAFDDRRSRLLEPFFGPLDGLAADRVADALVEWSAGRQPVGVRTSASLRGLLSDPTLAQRGQALFANIAGSRMAAGIRTRRSPARRGKRFSEASVRALLSAFEQCHPSNHRLQVEDLRHPISKMPLESLLVTSV